MTGRDVVELRALLAILDEGNFARAARRLGVSPSALSQTVRQLEARLGQRLLHRTTRSTRATAAGRQLAQRVRPALTELEEAQSALSRPPGEITGCLRINASRAGAAYGLAPRLSDFARHHPGVEVEIVVSDVLDDVVASGCDAGVRVSSALAQDMIAVPLTGPLRWVAIAAPAYLAEAGTPGHPCDLVHHRCLNMRWPGGGPRYRWEFARGAELRRVAVSGPLCCEDAATRLAAVETGLGIAYMMEAEARDALARGAVVEVLADWRPPEPGFALYYPGNRLVTPQLRAFVDRLTHTGSR